MGMSTCLNAKARIRRRDARVAVLLFFFFSSRRRHTRLQGDWSSDVCSSDLRGGSRQEVVRDEVARRHPVLLAARQTTPLGGLTLTRVRPAPEGAVRSWEIGRASCRERV